jgi:hypothetical protein
MEFDSYLDEPQDVDVFRFSVDEATRITVGGFSVSGMLPLQIEITNADGARLENDSEFAELGFLPIGEFEVMVEPGEYYISVATSEGQLVAVDVDGDGTADPISEYGLFVIRETTPVTPPVSVDVDRGEVIGDDPDADFLWEQPTPLAAVDATMQREAFIDDAGDQDLFQFQSENGGNVVLEARPLERPLIGDANGDGVFDSSDLVEVFQAGKYEKTDGAFANWQEGDWSGDGRFDSSDLLLAFQSNAYSREAEQQPLLDLEFMIMDIDGNIIGHSDDGSTVDDQGRILVEIASGETYYVMVAAQDRLDTGRYRISLKDDNRP